MITIYKEKSAFGNRQLIKMNDVFFNKYTVEKLDEKAKYIIAQIDNSEMINKYMIKSKFDGLSISIDKISTGCKTVLNIIYNPDKIFDIRECGENAVDFIYTLESGNIYCDYPLISFDMEKVLICNKKEIKEIDSYDELKEWWQNEN